MTPEGLPDYYAEFDIDPAATGDEVSRRLDRAFRTWSGRAGRAPDTKARRQAEDKTELISQARQELLDPARRRAYDRRLGRAGRQAVRPQPPSPRPAPKAPRARNGDWLRTARKLLEQGKEREALNVIEQSYGKGANNADALHMLGVLHARRGSSNGAMSAFRRALALRPNNASTHAQVAELHAAAGDHLSAAQEYTQAWRLDMNHPEWRVATADNLFRAARFDRALPWYEQALSHSVSHDHVGNQIGRIWLLRIEQAMTWHPGRKRYVIASPDSASTVSHGLKQAQAVSLTDDQLRGKLLAYEKEADRALVTTWQWDFHMAVVLAVCLVVGLLLPGFLKLAALVGALVVPYTRGRKPRWKHTYDGLPKQSRPQPWRGP